MTYDRFITLLFYTLASIALFIWLLDHFGKL